MHWLNALAGSQESALTGGSGMHWLGVLAGSQESALTGGSGMHWLEGTRMH